MRLHLQRRHIGIRICPVGRIDGWNQCIWCILAAAGHTDTACNSFWNDNGMIHINNKFCVRRDILHVNILAEYNVIVAVHHLNVKRISDLVLFEGTKADGE